MKQATLLLALAQAGLLRGPWQFDDLSYETVGAEFIATAARKWVDDILPAECTTRRDIGGGKMVAYPKWIPESGDCDNIARIFGAYLALCEWLKAARSGAPLGNLAAGLLRYVPDTAAGPSQGHAVNWFVDHAGAAHVFDAGLMDERHFSDAEKLSIFGGESI